jgi:hypothetical protein
MLQALLKNKLKDSFRDPYFRPSEDSLTSSVIGLMQFLPDDLFWFLLRQSCGMNSDLPADVGSVSGVFFWDRWSAEGTHNSVYVEPDIWLDTEKYYIVIEAKKSDYIGQHIDQWKNEIRALRNEKECFDKDILFIALGGNESLQNSNIEVEGIQYKIFTASWFNLLHSVTVYLSRSENLLGNNTERLLRNIIVAFSKHGYIDVAWLSSLKTRNISSPIKKIQNLMEFDNHVFFRDIYNSKYYFNKKILKIWKK